MRTLTEHQRNFLLEYFFKNEKYAGWKNIANKLLDTGQCIVPSISGNYSIWQGGIGNFIIVEDYSVGVDCSYYKFNLTQFLASEYYKETRKNYMYILSSRKEEVDKEYSEMLDLHEVYDNIKLDHLSVPETSNSFTSEQVLEILKDCEHLDDAKMTFIKTEL